MTGHFTGVAKTSLLLAMVRFFVLTTLEGRLWGKHMFSFLRGKYMFSLFFFGGGGCWQLSVLSCMAALSRGMASQ